MSEPDPVTVTIDRRVALVRFVRPHRGNPMDRAVIDGLHDAARRLAASSELNAIVLAGGDHTFTVGFDLAAMDGGAPPPAEERRRRVARDRALMDGWGGLEPMTIAAVEGWCVGGGAALACALDLRVFAESATLYMPEVERGMTVPGGTVPRLVALVGPARAKRVAVLAERIDAARAAKWGLVDAVVPDGMALDRAMEMAERAAALPPRQLRMIKRAANRAAEALAGSAAADDEAEFLEALATEDHAEALRAFREKRPPRFTGR